MKNQKLIKEIKNKISIFEIDKINYENTMKNYRKNSLGYKTNSENRMRLSSYIQALNWVLIQLEETNK
jgi:hypothetical protein